MRYAKALSPASGLPWRVLILPLFAFLLWSTSFPIKAAGSLPIAAPFEEQLIPTGPTSPQQDSDLAKAIEAYQIRPKPDDVHALTDFLRAHPHSAWSLALLTNVGLSDYHYGYFSRAIDDFQGAWREGRTATDPHAKALADRALSELLRMHGRLGHLPELTDLLAETQGRSLVGSANAVRDNAKDGLWLMHNRPGEAFLCGPMALKNLLHAGGTPAGQFSFLDSVRSGPHGVTLAEVGRLADQAKLRHTLVFRDRGEPIPVPSLVHWKVNHFAAIIGQQGDRFQVADPTFGRNLWVTREVLETDGSGYFLVPGQSHTASWRPVSPEEAGRVYGMGTTTTSDDTKVTPASPCACNGQPASDGGMTQYDFKEMLVSLHLSDTPVGYVPPIGPPVKVQLVYNQREAHQPANPAFSNVGPLWTLNFLSYVMDEPGMPGQSVTRFVSGGGESDQIGYNATSQTFAPDVQDGSVLSIVSTNPISYRRMLRDGSSEIYSASNGGSGSSRLVFLSQIIDPAGNALQLNYDAMMRLATIEDATKRMTTFAYGNSASPYLITGITDPFKRSASIGYDPASGQLTDITDVYGLNSHFTYTSSSSLRMTTPYGTTSFTFGDNGNQRYLQATDPLGYTEYLEFYQEPDGNVSDPTGTPSGMVDLYNQWITQRDTYYWDKHAYAVAPNDITRARQRHWAHLLNNGTYSLVTSDTIESVKYPLENRIWYNYPGQPTGYAGGAISGTYEQPSGIGRIMDDGTTQLTQIQYNGTGNVTGVTDPVGRQTQLVYASNGVDVMAVQQNTGTGFGNVAQFPSYTSQHMPVSYIDAAGQTTGYSYYPNGQLHTVTDPLKHTTTYNYNSNSDLSSVVDANGKKILSLTYDKFDRVLTSTDSEGWTVQYAYDALDRVTTETFPDKTTRIFNYQYLDLHTVTDRQGRVTTYTHDNDRRLTMVQDPAGNVTKFGYYENGQLASLTDPNGHTTTWNRDLESRVTSKQYADGHGLGYGYEAATSRLLYVADQLNQIKQYSYTLDDKPARITFYNSVNKTPNVAFSYDPYFPRLASMTDGSGTTQYQYYGLGVLGALQLAQETPPFANATIAYAYNKVGLLMTRSVGGDVEQFGYDKINRLATHVDDLGNFTRTYLGETTQLKSQSNGTLGTVWSYDTNQNDRRLTGIATAGGTSYGTSFSTENDLMGLTDSTNNLSWTYIYDPADRLHTATTTTGLSYTYNYDFASNLGQIQRPQGTTSVPPNNVNQAISVNGVASVYDANGNLLRDYARTFAWDADNRLITVGIIGQAGMQTNFKYDGFGRRVAIDTTSAGATSETRYQWCGETLCQARNDNDVISRRYLAEGENAVSLGRAFFYGVDQIGSMRDALNTNGSVAAHYDYEPYGTQSNTALATTDFKYGGLFFNQQTGTYLGTYRVYDSLVGRWINRDPIAEAGGFNLYDYTGSNPLTATDPAGLLLQIPEPVLERAVRRAVIVDIAGAGPEDPIADIIAGGAFLATIALSTDTDEEDCKSRQLLYHYTTEQGMMGILASQSINPSLASNNPNDVLYGEGQYFSDIPPGTMTLPQLSSRFIRLPFQGQRFSNYVTVDVTGLNVVMGRPHVYLVPNTQPLNVTGRVVDSGRN